MDNEEYKAKIKQACKMIVKLGDNYSLYDWHKTCVEVMNLGITKENLTNFIDQDTENSVLGDLYKGNYYPAANYLRNFLDWNDSIPWVMGYSIDVQGFLKVVNEQGD